MKHIVSTVLILVLSISTGMAQQQTVGIFNNSEASFNGYTLFSPLSSFDSYLINNCGEVVNEWTTNNSPGLMAYLNEEGKLYRTGRTSTGFGTGGVGGLLEIRDWDNTLEWSYEYAGDSIKQHHDIEIMPNGNILLIAWEKVSSEEAIRQGRNPNSMAVSEVWMEQIMELKPVGFDQMEIVWEWHVIDHLVQSYDDTKLNFGSVRDSLHLIDVNFGAFSTITPGEPGNRDWLHYNAVSYLPEEDLILFSSRNFNEIYIIDHSTTTEESSSHKGGNFGKGGDILFRWGNPAAYRNGNEEDQILFSQHNSDWVRKKIGPTGEISIFNNGLGRDQNRSSIEIITPERDVNGDFLVNQDGNFSILDHITIMSDQEIDFDSPRLSSAQVLENNNILICAGNKGQFFELDIDNNLTWSYLNPIGNFSATPQYQQPVGNDVFRALRYSPDFIGFEGKDLTPTQALEQNPIEDNCIIYDLSSTIDNISNNLEVFPNPFGDYLTVNSENAEPIYCSLYDVNGRLIFKKEIVGNVNIDTVEFQGGIYYLKLHSPHSERTYKLVKL